jgi:hypothetical protein
MIRLFQSLAIVGGLFVAALATPAYADGYATTRSAANLRKGPGVGYAVISTVPAGARLWVGNCQPGWCKAVWRNKTGWIAASLLRFTRSVPSAPIYDDYDYYTYEYWYGFDYGWPYYLPPRHYPKPWKPPHCKPGHDCKPPPCKGKGCGPWPKPDKPWGNKPPKWGTKPPKFDGQSGIGGNAPRQWKRFDGGGSISNGPSFSGGSISDNDFIVRRGPGGGDGIRGRGRGGRIWEEN